MQDEYRKLTREELDKLTGEPLPERAAMSLIHAHLAVPVTPLDPGVASHDPIVGTNPPRG
jgi:hypothetical protein